MCTQRRCLYEAPAWKNQSFPLKDIQVLSGQKGGEAGTGTKGKRMGGKRSDAVSLGSVPK